MPDTLTDDQHRWASRFCGIDTKPGDATTGAPATDAAAVSAPALAAAASGAADTATLIGTTAPPTRTPSPLPEGDEATPEIAQAAPIAGGVAIEVIIAFLALIAALIAILSLPHMGGQIEELLAKIQAAMASVADGIRQGADWIEEQVKDHTRAGMICSDQLIAFRKLTAEVLDALKQPRDPDPVKQAQNVIRVSNLIKAWKDALAALLACLNANLG
jgi:hypothetical protein